MENPIGGGAAEGACRYLSVVCQGPRLPTNLENTPDRYRARARPWCKSLWEPVYTLTR